MPRETKREELTIDQYLRGCNCGIISFSSGGYRFVMTDGAESQLINPNGHKAEISNDFKIIRHYDIETDELIEVEIREPIGDYNYKKLFYLMRPTGTFIHKE